MVVKWIRSILSASNKIVGKDHLGNTYFETVKSSGKFQRWFEPSGSMQHEQYKGGDLPHEWEAWLRGKRTEPPSIQEIEKNINYTTQVQVKAARKSIEDDRKQAEAFDEGLIQREQPQKSSSATAAPGSGSSYEPDTWKPGN